VISRAGIEHSSEAIDHESPLLESQSSGPLMQGTVAVADFGWYTHLRARPGLEEASFWKPSAQRAFGAPEFSPFFFKSKAPYDAICGFGYSAGRGLAKAPSGSR
jgi:hypothetical protein